MRISLGFETLVSPKSLLSFRSVDHFVRLFIPHFFGFWAMFLEVDTGNWTQIDSEIGMFFSARYQKHSDCD